MKISELIKELELFKEENGDLKVCVMGVYDIEIGEGFLISRNVENICMISEKEDDE